MEKTAQQESVEIIFITDQKFLLPTCVAIQSLYTNRNRNRSYSIHVVCNQVAKEESNRLLSMADEHFRIDLQHVTATALHDKFVKEGFPVSITATFKFSLAEMFPTLKKALYIDGDVIIQSGLEEFYFTDINDVYAGVIPDYHALTFKGDVWERLGIRLDAYFNSGVMLLNLEQMRRDGITEKLIDYRLHGVNYYMDQDTLNVVFGDKVRYLNFKYNMTLTNWRNKTMEELSAYYGLPQVEDKYDYLREADIVHFASSDKPWSYYDTHYADVWYSYFLLSPYRTTALERTSLHTIIHSREIENIRIQKANTALINLQQGKHPGGEVPLLSVVMPVYNAETFIGDAIGSVFAQSLARFEVICVDDGSTDKSGEILKQHKKDPRLRVFHQNNLGAGAARNRALTEARGEYVVFLDADDILAEDALELYYNTAIRTNADVVVSQTAEYSNDHRSKVINNWLREEYIPATDVISAKEIYPFVFNFTTGGVGGKCFKRSFITENTLRFLEIRKSEDFYFVHLGITKADRIALIRKPIYYIRQVQSSLEHQKDKMPLVFWDAIELLKARLEEEGLFEVSKQSFVNEAVNRFAYNLKTMKTEEGFEVVLEKLRQIAKKELGLGFYPEKYYYVKSNYSYLCKQLGLNTISPDSQEMNISKKKLAEAEVGRKITQRELDELEAIRASWSYRIGRSITFVPRKVRGSVQCYHDHGAGYTVRRTLYHMGLWEDEENPSYDPSKFNMRVPDKLSGGVQCYRDHGVGYTLRRVLYHMGLWKDEEAPKGPENHPKLISGAERFVKGKREKKKG